MNRKISLLFLGICLSTISYSQTLTLLWEQMFQGQGKVSDRIAAIQTDNAGNVYVAGYAGNHHGSPDAFAMKRSSAGDTLWVYYYDGGGKNEDYATDIVIDASGNTYITGKSQNASYVYECFTAKISPTGTPLWATRYSPGSNTQSYGNAITVDASGNVYVAGYTDPTSGSNDWLVIKYNSSGAQQWVDVLNGPGNGSDEAMDIVIAPNGNPTVCGYTYSLNASGATNAFIKQYTPSNGTVWTDTWTNPNFTGTDKALGLGFISGGSLYVGGETRNSTSSNQDAFAIQYDQTGLRVWDTIYTDATSTVDEYFTKVTIDVFGNVFFTGTDYQNGFITCIKHDGSLGWRKTWTGPISNGKDVFHGITTDEAGNVYAAGRGVYAGPDYYGNGGTPNLIITKYNEQGDTIWTYRCQETTRSSMGFSITYNNGKLYAGGFVTDTAYVDENLYTVIVDTTGAPVHEWTYNGKGDAITMGQFVETDPGNNIYCGATIDRLHGEGTDVVLIKYDPSGNLLWETYYSSPGFNNDTLTGMQFAPSGELILSISSDIGKTKNNYRLSLIKASQNGELTDTSWCNMTGSTLANSINIDSDGNIALSANSNINGGMLVFFDTSMTCLWYSKLDSTVSSVTKAYSSAFFQNGDIAICGYTQYSGITSAIVHRFSPSGNKLWTAYVDSTGVFDEIRDISVNTMDEIAFTGRSGNFALLGKMNGTNGTEIWRQYYNPTTSSEYGVKVEFTPAGNLAFICRGWTGFVARYFTAQYSSTGTYQWAQVYSQTASDREPVDLLVETTNSIVTAGWAINNTTTNYDFVLVGYNSSGVNQFTNTYTTPGAPYFSWDQLRDLNRDNAGNYIITGQTAAEFYNTYLFKMLTLKYGGITVGESESDSFYPQSSATAYPNPSSEGIFTIIDASPFAIAEGKVYDICGREVAALCADNHTVDLQNLSTGIYFLTIQRADATTEVIKLVKN